jgi:hypothetical protein
MTGLEIDRRTVLVTALGTALGNHPSIVLDIVLGIALGNRPSVVPGTAPETALDVGLGTASEVDSHPLGGPVCPYGSRTLCGHQESGLPNREG